MVLISQQNESSSSRWYRKNKQQLSEKRKQRYAQDPEYRKRAVEASRRRRRGERSLTGPPQDAPISFAEAAEQIGVSRSILREWRRRNFFPEPKHNNGRLWFSEKQVLLLKQLKDRVYKKRRWYLKSDRFREVITSTFANWV